MTLTVRLFGLELLHFEVSTDPPEDDDTQRDLSGGNLTATPMGFVPHMEKPNEIQTPDRDW